MKGWHLFAILLLLSLGVWLTPATYREVAPARAVVTSYGEGNFGVTDPELYRDAQPSSGCTQV